jgi:hypothetical protein
LPTFAERVSLRLMALIAAFLLRRRSCPP